MVVGRFLWEAASDAPGDLMVEAFEGGEHCLGGHPAFAATEQDSLCNGLVEEADNVGWKSGFGEDVGEGCPFVASFGHIGNYCGPVTVGSGHGSALVFEGLHGLEWCVVDFDA